MRYSHRFFLYAPFGVLLILAVVISVYWQRTADSFDGRLARVNGHEIIPGVQFSYASRTLQGFPFRIDSLIDGLSVRIETEAQPVVWRTQRFAMHMLDYDRSRQLFELDGLQSVAWTDASGRPQTISFVPGTFRASAIHSGGGLVRVDLDIVSLHTPNIAGDRLQFHMRRNTVRNVLDFVMQGDRIKLACPAGSATAGELTAEGQIAPAAPFRALLEGRADWRSAYSGWQQSRGQLKIDRIDVRKPAPDRQTLTSCTTDFLQHALSFVGRP